MRVLVSLSLSISLCLWVGAAWAAPQPGPERACAQQGLISGPPDLTDPAYDCGRCHAEQSRWVERTLMATASGIINQTRFLWGAQPDAGPRVCGGGPRRPCNSCPLTKTRALWWTTCSAAAAWGADLGPRGPNRPEGAKRRYPAPLLPSCVACHILTGSDRIAGDQKLPGAGDKAWSPRATTAVPTSQCLHCHRGNYVGADYAGLFERDYSTSYNFEAKDPEIVPYPSIVTPITSCYRTCITSVGCIASTATRWKKSWAPGPSTLNPRIRSASAAPIVTVCRANRRRPSAG